jgi:hypothetical protein
MMATGRVSVALSLLALCLGCGPNERTPHDPSSHARRDMPDQVRQGSTNLSDPVAILRAAIDAHGGESNFAKARTGKTVMTIDGNMQPGVSGRFEKIDLFQFPDKHKRVVSGKTQDESFQMNYVRVGDQAWMQVNGGERMPLPVIAPDRGVFPADFLDSFAVLAEPSLSLALLPTQDFQGKPVYALRATLADGTVADSFFDRETNLAVASRKELFDTTVGRTRSIETRYATYEKVDGLTLPMSIDVFMDGQAWLKTMVTEVTFRDKIDEREFAAPAAQQ